MPTLVVRQTFAAQISGNNDEPVRRQGIGSGVKFVRRLFIVQLDHAGLTFLSIFAIGQKKLAIRYYHK
ncbi:MAG TPA: hypothetical protein VIE89_08040 [Candidatus Binatia bacterium]